MQATSTVNGVDLARLSAVIEHVTDEPMLAQFQFRASNEWILGAHSRTTIKGFYGAGVEDSSRTNAYVLESDEPPVLLGENIAPNAGEHLLNALAACITGTIAYQAAARGIELQSMRTTVEGDINLYGFLGLDPNVRPGFEQVKVTVTADGNFDDAQWAELVTLHKYSPVRDTVMNPVPVAVDYVRAA
jgi:uncharacterized OsmC-like protein